MGTLGNELEPNWKRKILVCMQKTQRGVIYGAPSIFQIKGVPSSSQSGGLYMSQASEKITKLVALVCSFIQCLLYLQSYVPILLILYDSHQQGHPNHPREWM